MVMGGIALQAPIAVMAETHFAEIAPFIKAWKEILLLPILLAIIALIYQRGQGRWFISNRFIQTGCAFVVLHGIVALLSPHGQYMQVFSGLLIDTRFVVYFLFIYTLLHIERSVWGYIVIPAIAAAVGVALFGVLQVLILPKDILVSLGYGANTIQPYLTVDNNEAYIRINSTLRGPNPLGLYIAIMASFIVGYLMTRLKNDVYVRVVTFAAIGLVGLFVLMHTHSRSAYITAMVTAMLFSSIVLRRAPQIRKIVTGITVTVIFLAAGALAVTWQTPFVQQVIFHTDVYEENNINSDEQHHASVQAAIAAVMNKPFGAGIGSTGSASLFSDTPFIIENYYLFVAHEVGWIGLLLFIGLWVYVLYELLRKATPMSTALGASGVGIMIAAMVLPVWADDTVALTWWGLAAAVLAVERKYKK